MPIATNWNKVDAVELEPGKEKYLRDEYVLIARRHLQAIKVAAIIVLIVTGVSVWQLAKAAGATALEKEGAKAASDHIKELEKQAIRDSETLTTLLAKWQEDDPSSALRRLEANIAQAQSSNKYTWDICSRKIVASADALNRVIRIIDRAGAGMTTDDRATRVTEAEELIKEAMTFP